MSSNERLEKLQKLSEKSNVRQVEMSRAAGIERARLSMIFNGHIECHPEELQRLEQFILTESERRQEAIAIAISRYREWSSQ